MLAWAVLLARQPTIGLAKGAMTDVTFRKPAQVANLVKSGPPQHARRWQVEPAVVVIELALRCLVVNNLAHDLATEHRCLAPIMHQSRGC